MCETTQTDLRHYSNVEHGTGRVEGLPRPIKPSEFPKNSFGIQLPCRIKVWICSGWARRTMTRGRA